MESLNSKIFLRLRVTCLTSPHGLPGLIVPANWHRIAAISRTSRYGEIFRWHHNSDRFTAYVYKCVVYTLNGWIYRQIYGMRKVQWNKPQLRPKFWKVARGNTCSPLLFDASCSFYLMMCPNQPKRFSRSLSLIGATPCDLIVSLMVQSMLSKNILSSVSPSVYTRFILLLRFILRSK